MIEYFDPKVTFFPVDLEPVYIENANESTPYKELVRFRAVKDLETGHVFAVVTNNYNLVLNKFAYENGCKIMSEVFNVIKPEDLKCINVIMSNARSSCVIDMVNHGSDFHPFDKDPWIAFLRISNSYNKTSVLRYELGFCRGFCKNGLVLGGKNVEFSTVHVKSASLKKVNFINNIGDIRELELFFVANLKLLRGLSMEKELMLKLVCLVFGVKAKSDSEKKAKQDAMLMKMQIHVSKLINEYIPVLGENAYAALNILTDIATRPSDSGFMEQNVHLLQKQVGKWVAEFNDIANHESFNWEFYLKSQENIVEYIEHLAKNRQLNFLDEV